MAIALLMIMSVGAGEILYADLYSESILRSVVLPIFAVLSGVALNVWIAAKRTRWAMERSEARIVPTRGER